MGNTSITLPWQQPSLHERLWGPTVSPHTPTSSPLLSSLYPKMLTEQNLAALHCHHIQRNVAQSWQCLEHPHPIPNTCSVPNPASQPQPGSRWLEADSVVPQSFWAEEILMVQPRCLGSWRLTAPSGLSQGCLYSALMKISPGSLLRLTISVSTAAVGSPDLHLSVGNALPIVDLEDVGVGLWLATPRFTTWTWWFWYHPK